MSVASGNLEVKALSSTAFSNDRTRTERGMYGQKIFNMLYVYVGICTYIRNNTYTYACIYIGHKTKMRWVIFIVTYQFFININCTSHIDVYLYMLHI